MEDIIEELLKKVAEVKKTPESYEILTKLDNINIESFEEIRELIDNFKNLEE